ncbi:hypothetical protein ZHAS_00003996 [Anopheles sinensis]|uniref:Uncharacterized protein n=1 Tax=Anopheles sinensis TaxID=74873 RepID=A0A084VFT7_ANOSI|nr:hypothetical protein ZHAS_00003996 [Anopheles sinensis]
MRYFIKIERNLINRNRRRSAEEFDVLRMDGVDQCSTGQSGLMNGGPVVFPDGRNILPAKG